MAEDEDAVAAAVEERAALAVDHAAALRGHFDVAAGELREARSATADVAPDARQDVA
jgi:hypothetical protein